MRKPLASKFNVSTRKQSMLFRQLKNRYENDPNVAAVLVGGSHARGDAGSHSDIDVLLLVKRKRTYIRYYLGDLHIEIDAVRLRDVPSRLRKDPSWVYALSETRPLVDPCHAWEKLQGHVEKFKRSYRVPVLMKADLYIMLKNLHDKIAGALEKRESTMAAYYSALSIEKIIAGLFAANGQIVPPVTHAWRYIPSLPNGGQVWKTFRALMEGSVRERPVVARQMIHGLLPKLRPAMSAFAMYYQPWKEKSAK